MTEEAAQPGGSGEGGDAGGSGSAETTTQPPKQEPNKADRREAELARKYKEIATERDELRAKLDEVEAQKRKAEEDEAIKAGKFEELVQVRNQDIAERDQTIEGLKSEIVKLQGDIVERDIVDGLMEHATANRKTVKAVYRAYLEEYQLDRIPDHPDRHSKKVLTGLKEAHPELFAPKGRAGSPGRGAPAPRAKQSPFLS